MNRKEIIQEAESWEGTKWAHQAALKGVACDCIGLICGVYKNITGVEFDNIINYAQTPFFYCREERLYQELQKYLIEIPVKDAKQGDILTFAYRERFPDHHLGIILNDGFFIHSCCDPGVNKVIITRYDEQWKARTRHAFRYPGVID